MWLLWTVYSQPVLEEALLQQWIWQVNEITLEVNMKKMYVSSWLVGDK